MWADLDRVTVIEGRMARPDRADEAVITPTAGMHIGQVLPMGYYTAARSVRRRSGRPGWRRL